MKEYFEDDRCLISEEVKNMSKEEREMEIKKLEEKGKKERENIRNKKKLALA